MASDRFQMINTLFHAMIDGIIYSIVLIFDELFNFAVGFRLFVIHRRSQRDTFLRRPCIRPSVKTLEGHIAFGMFVRPYS